MYIIVTQFDNAIGRAVAEELVEQLSVANPKEHETASGNANADANAKAPTTVVCLVRYPPSRPAKPKERPSDSSQHGGSAKKESCPSSPAEENEKQANARLGGSSKASPVLVLTHSDDRGFGFDSGLDSGSGAGLDFDPFGSAAAVRESAENCLVRIRRALFCHMASDVLSNTNQKDNNNNNNNNWNVEAKQQPATRNSSNSNDPCRDCDGDDDDDDDDDDDGGVGILSTTIRIRGILFNPYGCPPDTRCRSNNNHNNDEDSNTGIRRSEAAPAASTRLRMSSLAEYKLVSVALFVDAVLSARTTTLEMPVEEFRELWKRGTEEGVPRRSTGGFDGNGRYNNDSDSDSENKYAGESKPPRSSSWTIDNRKENTVVPAEEHNQDNDKDRSRKINGRKRGTMITNLGDCQSNQRSFPDNNKMNIIMNNNPHRPLSSSAATAALRIILVGTEAARGLPKMGIPVPSFRDETESSVRDRLVQNQTNGGSTLTTTAHTPTQWESEYAEISALSVLYFKALQVFSSPSKPPAKVVAKKTSTTTVGAVSGSLGFVTADSTPDLYFGVVSPGMTSESLNIVHVPEPARTLSFRLKLWLCRTRWVFDWLRRCEIAKTTDEAGALLVCALLNGAVADDDDRSGRPSVPNAEHGEADRYNGTSSNALGTGSEGGKESRCRLRWDDVYPGGSFVGALSGTGGPLCEQSRLVYNRTSGRVGIPGAPGVESGEAGVAASSRDDRGRGSGKGGRETGVGDEDNESSMRNDGDELCRPGTNFLGDRRLQELVYRVLREIVAE